MSLQHRLSRHAFSLIETTIACLLTSLLIVTALKSSAILARSLSRQGYALAAEEFAGMLLNEVAEKAFQDPGQTTTVLGTESGESTGTRTTLDDVDDYNGLLLNIITDRNGSVLSAANKWKAQFTVGYVQPSAPQTVVVAVTPLKRIVLDLTDPSGRVRRFTALRANRGLGSTPVFGNALLETTANIAFEYASRTWSGDLRLSNQQQTIAGGSE